MKMVNDLAFVIAGALNLYEHQSTYNPNMPLRFLLYIAEEYDKLIHQQDVDLYGGKLIMLPTLSVWYSITVTKKQGMKNCCSFQMHFKTRIFRQIWS